MTELRKPRMGGFHENRLIRCVKEREREMRRKSPLEPAKIPPQDLKVDRWFLTRFSIASAYLGLCEEFYSLEGSQNAWELQKGKGSPFICTPTGGSATRQLKTNAQRIRFGSREYIASEGPTNSTVFDFWTLIWQEGVDRILSVNFPNEERLYPSIYDQNKETVQYWPILKGAALTFMPFKITCIDTSIKRCSSLCALTSSEMVYRLSALRLSCLDPIAGPQPDRIVSHLCYYRWPDGRLPLAWPPGRSSDTQTSLALVDSIDQEVGRSPQPLLVHCHAGLGRTGVLIALDCALDQLITHNTVNIKGVVEKLRECRARAVMNPWQYAYINVVIAEKAVKLGLLPSHLGGHSVRNLIQCLWEDINADVERQFNGQVVTYG